MNDKKVILAFILGAAAGSVASWFFTKNKYEEIMTRENEDSREYWKNYYANNSEKELEEVLEEEDAQWERVEEAAAEIRNEGPTIQEYAARLAEEGYQNYSEPEEPDTEPEEEEVEEEMVEAPYVISVNDFGMTDYELSSLTVYADGVVTDDFDEVVDNPASLIGQDHLNEFMRSEADFIYIRNDGMKTDFEVQRTDENYSDRNDS